MHHRNGRVRGFAVAAMIVVLVAGVSSQALAADLPFDPNAAYYCKPAESEAWGETQIHGAQQDGSRELLIEGSGPKSATCAMAGDTLRCDWGFFQFLGWGRIALDLSTHVPWGEYPVWVVSGTLKGAPWFRLWPPVHSGEIECLVPWKGDGLPELPPEKRPKDFEHRRGGERPY